MIAVTLLTFIGLTFGQQRTCLYEGGPNNRYTLNLTSVYGYHLEYKDTYQTGRNYYFTPCTNNEQCRQGNANFYANAVQYQPGANQCIHYLSVDHHETPTYFYGAASWAFMYSDGELCDVTQQPRDLNVFMLCDENFPTGAYIADVYEYETCRYSMQIRTPLACVPESTHHANCQWRYQDTATNTTYYLDLSSQKGKYIRGPVSGHGYEQFYSPCENGLHCYQQAGGDIMVQSILENTVTHTCELYLSEWQEGRVVPIFHNSQDQKSIHWSFHYFLSEKCMNGQPGEETIRWYCDPDVVNNTLINATYDGDCRHEMNVASSLACPSNKIYNEFNGVPKEKLFMDMRKLYK